MRQSLNEIYRYLPLPLMVVFCIISIMVMQVISDLRVEEVSLTFQKYRQEQGSDRTSSLVARFEILQRQSAESETSYLKEGKQMSILSDQYSENQDDRKRYSLLNNVVKSLMNQVASLTGSEIRFSNSDQKKQRLIELAYMNERKRKFNKSIAIYDYLDSDFDNQQKEKAYIYLHRGYCKALIGQRQQAISDLENAARLGKGAEVGSTAKVLKTFTSQIEQRHTEIEKMPLSLEKSIALYKALNYSAAIDSFNQLEKYQKSQILYFYRGRAYEETGQTRNALKDYERVINSGAFTEYARLANRRIYMLGTYYSKNKSLQKVAITTARRNNDNSFIDRSKRIEKALDLSKEEKLANDEKSSRILNEVENSSGKELVDDKNQLKEMTVKLNDRPVVKPVKPRPVKVKPKPKPLVVEPPSIIIPGKK